LKSAVGQEQYIFRNAGKFVLKQLEIMRFALCLSDGYDLFCFLIGDN
jgi:hypothetical protein